METIEWNWNTRDGLNIHSKGWSPISHQKGVVCLIHGLGEHTGRYAHVGEALCKAKYALVGYDLRGHGKSGGKQGHIPSYQALMDDISDFISQVKQKYPGKPVFLFGHSLGGNQVLNFGIRNRPKIQGVIASGPWLKLAFEPPPAKIALAKIMVKIMPTFTLKSGLEIAALSHVSAVVEAYKKDPLVHDRISANTFICATDAGIWALEHAYDFPLPLLLIHGTADRICSVEGSRQFARIAFQKVEPFFIDGLYHETHNELSAPMIFETIIRWLDEHII